MLESELKWYKAVTINDTASNGGKMSDNEYTTDVKNDILPDLSESDTSTGLTRYRKLFLKVANDDDVALLDPAIYQIKLTPGNDYIQFFEATQTDIQGGITGSERTYGSAYLPSSLTGIETVFDVTIEDPAQVIFVSGDTIFISDGTNIEYHENVTISKVGTTVTITLDNSNLSHSWNHTNTIVGSVLDLGASITTSYDSVLSTTAGDGVFNDTGNIDGDNIATIEADWTITIDLDNESFTCTSPGIPTTYGSMLSDFAPPNSNQSNKPYFILRAAGWVNSWVSSDTLTFTTHPASAAIWIENVVPAGTGAYTYNDFGFAIIGDPAS